MAFSMAWLTTQVEGKSGDDRARGLLAAFRGELYRCFATYRDALLELADAVLCKQDRVHMLAELSLEPEHRRGHGALYGAVNCGRVDIARLRWSLACLPLPAWDDGRIRLAADVSNWLRPDAATSPDRLFCHCYARGRGNAQMIPGWPYSVIAALEPGRTSWTLPLDAVRLGPADDATAVTAAQVREVAERIIAAGHWRDGDPDILVVFDAGYDLTRLAWLLAGLPVEVLGRLRSDRVMYFPAPPRLPGTNGRPLRHGAAFRLADERILARPRGGHRHPDHPVRHRPGRGLGTAAPAAGQPRRLGRPRRRAAGRRGHPHPAVRGPPARRPQPRTAVAMVLTRRTSAAEVNRAWQAFLRRFDIEHMFRFFKQVLGWTRPKLRDPAAADRWTWIVIACYVQLRLARGLAADIRLPWQRPCPPGRLTPARVRRGFRNIRQTLPRSGQRAETRQTRPRPPARIEEPPPGHPPRRGKDRQAGRPQEENPQPGRLNNKLRACR